MQLVAGILPYIGIISSVLMISAILLDQSGAEVGGALGGGNDSFHQTRRGFQKFLFYLAIVSAIFFTASAIASILIK